MLDLAGGTGSFLLAILRRHSHLRATLVELPRTVEVARRHLAQAPGGEAIRIVAGDVRTDPLPPGHDTILLANIAHLFSPGTNRAVLRRIRDGADAGTRLVLVDFWTDPTHPAAIRGAAGGRVPHRERGGGSLQRGRAASLTPRVRLGAERAPVAGWAGEPAHRGDERRPG